MKKVNPTTGSATLDSRFSDCSEQARGELEVYLEWLDQNKISDSEYSFVMFALGRSGLKEVRHILLIWLRQLPNGLDREKKSQVRRFFMNPSADVSFNLPSSAEWFNFLPILYQQTSTMKLPTLVTPKFTKVGFSDLPG